MIVDVQTFVSALAEYPRWWLLRMVRAFIWEEVDLLARAKCLKKEREWSSVTLRYLQVHFRGIQMLLTMGWTENYRKRRRLGLKKQRCWIDLLGFSTCYNRRGSPPRFE